MDQQVVDWPLGRTDAEPDLADTHTVDPSLSALWERYKREGDVSDRNHLIVHYVPLVKYVAGRMQANLPSSVQQGDLIQSGIFGLEDAIKKFDPNHGNKFETYAVHRIRGAITDYLRQEDWVPRSVRARIKEVERTVRELEKRFGRSPEEHEIARELDISEQELKKIWYETSFANVMALEDLTENGFEIESAFEGDGGISEETRQAFLKSIRGLPEKDRIVISLYHLENLTLAEIGEVFGVTESRACQLHTKAMVLLRAALVNNGALD